MKNLKEIPDTNFRNEMKRLFPNAFENELLDVNNNEIIKCKKLIVTHLKIKDLTGVEWFVNLEYLYCSNNQLISLPNLPSTLKDLDCDNNQLTSLPILPSTLKILYCFDNRLTSLSNLPSTLKKLYCYNNQLTTLPTLPKTLEYLGCHYNNLTALPNLPGTLKGLWCSNNNTKMINTYKIIECTNLGNVHYEIEYYYHISYNESLKLGGCAVRGRFKKQFLSIEEAENYINLGKKERVVKTIETEGTRPLSEIIPNYNKKL